MALDMAKMKAKLQELESGGRQKSDNVFWKPQEGDQDIRIVPTEDGDPFKVFHFHYNLGEAARGGVCRAGLFGGVGLEGVPGVGHVVFASPARGFASGVSVAGGDVYPFDEGAERARRKYFVGAVLRDFGGRHRAGGARFVHPHLHARS